jgi:hypothetical protein
MTQEAYERSRQSTGAAASKAPADGQELSSGCVVPDGSILILGMSIGASGSEPLRPVSMAVGLPKLAAETNKLTAAPRFK